MGTRNTSNFGPSQALVVTGLAKSFLDLCAPTVQFPRNSILFLIILFSVCTRVPQTSGVPHGASHTDDQQESQDAKENISYPHDNNEVVGEV